MAKKGQKFKTWTADEKYNVIKPIIDLEISLAQTGKNTGVSNSMLHRWIKSYKENGYDGLKAKKKWKISQRKASLQKPMPQLGKNWKGRSFRSSTRMATSWKSGSAQKNRT